MAGSSILMNTAAEIFGYHSADEMKDVSVLDLYHQKEKRNELIQILTTTGQLTDTEVQLVKKEQL